ncbi:MAG: Fe-S oxidoreductase [Sphingobacteriia bacterium 24-36-13]|jgi:ferredoxin|uniref:(Fe-S)-binding protein n=1 Tax=Sediminibacterium sp. TaxID=1917865 RepID=UPI000BC4079C|nr:(Fe-S)-binding protein [Sediminibacterium sp.]OYY10058.1 MAG: Fe-S oxidoreductase [Sphingobacteriia bacterium 35-36-14]OYZ53782.1 MAG: Fe-S oxidoreductase [Sphingobacteriia bacterium 24-36-13]OZA65755.1 MAG: Fe-S oxidoreductase [Sphingobacteriia bacterium 39-36-14]HQS24513.1 (Fe-S)-binding protein [Sediminibacterium sp.]HQS34337.1 (Fe-S)-binding protein [Sediminibacterium sp.]
MEYLQQALFVLMAISAIYLFAKKVGEIRRNIFLGKALDLSDNAAIRWKNLLLLAMGQKKMFKNIPVALMHFIIYAGFIIINIEVLEIVLDGILGTHRLFLPLLGGIYNWLINIFEVLALGVLVVCVLFLARRNWLKLKRFVSKDLNGWPKTDANFILITEIILMSLFLIMNAADQLLQQNGAEHYAVTGSFSISSFLMPLFEGFSNSTLIGIERTAWWIHIAGIFAFLNYLPYSKHLHIALAFPNAYYAKLDSPGKINNMPEVQNEVLYAMQPELAPANAAPPASFGAKDVFDLSWKNLLDAYSCTECGRCTAECPANITGKLLSPRKIMMATRDRLEEVGKNINQNKSFIQDGKSLLHDYISVEELRACTTCNACVEACPVSISPLDIIVELRRSLIMEESNAPQEWNSTFSNIENNFAPWKFSPDDRDKWASEMAS